MSKVDPVSLLYSESEDEGDVKQVMVADSGSRSQLARVSVQGVHAEGVVDTTADITIMGGKLWLPHKQNFASKTSSLLTRYRRHMTGEDSI